MTCITETCASRKNSCNEWPTFVSCKRNQAKNRNRYATDPEAVPSRGINTETERGAPSRFCQKDQVTMTCDQPHGLGGFVGEILALRWAMWVLVLATASFLLFLSIVLLLWLADTLESRNIQHNRNACLEQPFAFLSIAQAFEPALAVLWEARTHRSRVSRISLYDRVAAAGIV